MRLRGWVGLLLLAQGCAPKVPLQGMPEGGRPVAFREAVMLGGHRQWVMARGTDAAKPILLFLHGGPGAPTMGLAHAFQAELEKDFVVVQWDQRGSGKSLPGTPPESMTVARFQADTHELVLWLKQRFRRERIYLLGHSWGSYLGLWEARLHPENLWAYIGTGQMVDLVAQERRSHAFVTAWARETGKGKALARLAAVGEPPYRDAVKGMDLKYGLLWEAGGMLDGETGPAPFVKALLRSPDYSCVDLVRFVRGGSFSLKHLARNEGEAFWHLKAPDPGTPFQVPIGFITGDRDRVTSPALLADYVTRLQAPLVRSLQVEGAGHFAFFTHPKAFAAALREIQQGVGTITR